MYLIKRISRPVQNRESCVCIFVIFSQWNRTILRTVKWCTSGKEKQVRITGGFPGGKIRLLSYHPPS